MGKPPASDRDVIQKGRAFLPGCWREYRVPLGSWKTYSADKQRRRAGVTLCPTNAHKRRLIVITQRITYAKIADELPRFGNLECARNHLGFENRNPAYAHPACTCSDPKYADSHHRGILQCLRHRLPSE